MATFPPVRNLRIDEGLVVFDFKPSLGIIARDLDRLGLDIRSFREPLKRSVQQVMIPSFHQNFELGGRPTWPELSERTLQRHAEEGGSGRPLVKSGLLERVATQLNIWTITQNTASIRGLPPKVWYGNLHQQGYGTFGARRRATGASIQEALQQVVSEARAGQGKKAAKVVIPQREFINIQGEDYDDIEEVFSKWLQERIDRFIARGLGDRLVRLSGR